MLRARTITYLLYKYPKVFPWLNTSNLRLVLCPAPRLVKRMLRSLTPIFAYGLERIARGLDSMPVKIAKIMRDNKLKAPFNATKRSRPDNLFKRPMATPPSVASATPTFRDNLFQSMTIGAFRYLIFPHRPS